MHLNVEHCTAIHCNIASHVHNTVHCYLLVTRCSIVTHIKIIVILLCIVIVTPLYYYNFVSHCQYCACRSQMHVAVHFLQKITTVTVTFVVEIRTCGFPREESTQPDSGSIQEYLQSSSGTLQPAPSSLPRHEWLAQI